MPKTREALAETFEEQAKRLRVKAKNLLNGKLDEARLGLPPTFPAYVDIHANEYGNVFLFVPNDPEKLGYVRDRLRKFGWEVGDFEVSDWGSHRVEAKLPNNDPDAYSWEATRNSVDIVAMDSREGATCKTVRVGTTLKEMDVWETRCNEGEDI